MNKIDEFLKGLPKNTEKAYRTGLNKYLAWFKDNYPNENFDNYIQDIRRMDKDERIDTTDRYEKDIRDWVIELKKQYAPKTVSCDIASVRGLLTNNRIDLDKVFWKKIKGITEGNASLCEVIVSTPQELKEILTHSPDARAKAFFMVLATSGMRIGELCILKYDPIGKTGDIKLQYQCPRIRIPLLKITGDEKERGNTRITPEAKTVVLEYLKVRSRIIKRAYQRSVNVGRYKPLTKKQLDELVKNEDRLFPFDVHTMQGIWNTMLKKSGYDETDKSSKVKIYNKKTGKYYKLERYKRNVHSLRKFFRTNFSKYNKNLAVYFMNQISDLEETYDHKSEEWLDQEYMNGSQYLAVFESTQEYSEKIQDMDNRMAEKDKQVQDLSQKTNGLRLDLLETKHELGQALKLIQELQKKK